MGIKWPEASSRSTAMPEMRTVNRVVLTGICAYVFVASCWCVVCCWLPTRSPAPFPAEPGVTYGPTTLDQWKALQALKDLVRFIVVFAHVIRQGLFPFWGKPSDLQDALKALDKIW
jgi:hypothetical protein